VGETFAYDDRDLLKAYVDPDTMLDGQFDFPFKARVCEALFTPGGSLEGFANWMAGNDSFYGAGSIMTTWIGNHDIPRAIHFASRQIGDCRQGSFYGNGWSADFPQPQEDAAYERLGLSFAIMMTNPGIPLIYYGDEIGLAGGGDPDNRRMMAFDDAGMHPAQVALRSHVSALGQIRAENKVLARGRRITLSTSQDTWVYRMTGCGGGDVTVAINRADDPRGVAVPAGAYVDLMTDAAVQGGERQLPARSFLVLRAE
jgi:glycosidase